MYDESYDLCDTQPLLLSAAKLPDHLRKEIHDFAKDTLRVTQAAEISADAAILEALGISAATEFAAKAFYYMSRKLAQFDEAEPLAAAATAITFLLSATFQNAHNQVLEIEQKEVSIEHLLASIAELAKEIAEATADNDNEKATNMASELQHLSAELAKKTAVLQQTAFKSSMSLT